jgi:hypothetical protein
LWCLYESKMRNRVNTKTALVFKGDYKVEKQLIGKGTCSVWAGEEEYLMQNATQVPVVHSVSFGYKDVNQLKLKLKAVK